MGRYRSSSNSRRARNIDVYDESDESSFFEIEDSLRRGRQGGGRSSRPSYKGKSNKGKKFGLDGWMSDSDYSSPSDGFLMKAYGERSRSKIRSRLGLHDSESDSDDFDRYGSGRAGNKNRKQSRGRKVYEIDSSDDSDFDDGRNFSSKVKRLLKKKNRSSYSSDEDSLSVSRSSRRNEGARRTSLRGSGPNQLQQQQQQQPQRPMGSRPQFGRTMSQNSFNGLEQTQIAVPPPRQNFGLMRSNSTRSIGTQERNSFPPQMPFLGQAQGQTITGVSGNTNLQGNLVRSMSSRSINNLSSGQQQMNRPGLGGMMQSQNQPRPGMTRVASQNSLGNIGGMIQPQNQPRPGMVRMASQNSLGNIGGMTQSQNQPRPGMVRMASQNSLGNTNALLNQTNSLRQGLMRMASQNSLANNDALLNNAMHTRRPGLMTVPSERSLGNINTLPNAPMHSQRPGLVRTASQRSIGSNNDLQSVNTERPSPNMRMNTPKLPSVAGDSVSVLSGMSGETSVHSFHSRRSSGPPSLRDQIYSRSRHGDSQSVGSSGDPPGVDSNSLKKKVNKRYSKDDSSCDTFREDQESYFSDDQDSYFAEKDPPDMYEYDGSSNDISRDESDSDLESYRSEIDRQGFYSEDDSSVSSSDEGGKYSYKPRRPNSTASSDTSHREFGGSLSDSSVNSGSSVRGQSKEKDSKESSSRFSADLAFEYEKEITPPERTSSFKSEIGFTLNTDKHDDNSEVDGVDEIEVGQEPVSWLARQISNRKLAHTVVGTRSLEPKGTSTTEGDEDFYSKKIESIEGSVSSDSDGHVRNTATISAKAEKPKLYLPSEIDIFDESETSDAGYDFEANLDILRLTDRMYTRSRDASPVVIRSTEDVMEDESIDVVDISVSSREGKAISRSRRTEVEHKCERTRSGSPILTKKKKNTRKSSKKKQGRTDSSVGTEKSLKEKGSKKKKKKKSYRIK